MNIKRVGVHDTQPENSWIIDVRQLVTEDRILQIAHESAIETLFLGPEMPFRDVLAEEVYRSIEFFVSDEQWALSDAELLKTL